MDFVPYTHETVLPLHPTHITATYLVCCISRPQPRNLLGPSTPFLPLSHLWPCEPITDLLAQTEVTDPSSELIRRATEIPRILDPAASPRLREGP